MKSIPKQNVVLSSSVPLAKTPTISKIVFSFESLERNEYFDLPATCEKWSIFMMEQLKVVSQLTTNELRNRQSSMLRFHYHERANPPVEIPNNVALKDMCQIRFGTNRGGIHGVLVDNIFYVIWLDPLHNMYPSERHGGLKKIDPLKSCCMEFFDEIDLLKQEINKLKDENKQLNDDINDLLLK